MNDKQIKDLQKDDSIFLMELVTKQTFDFLNVPFLSLDEKIYRLENECKRLFEFWYEIHNAYHDEIIPLYKGFRVCLSDIEICYNNWKFAKAVEQQFFIDFNINLNQL